MMGCELMRRLRDRWDAFVVWCVTLIIGGRPGA